MKDGPKDQAPSRIGKLALTRVTTVERIADGICDLILRGEVVPGTPLRESQLQEWIGVSRNTIREALRLLERDGLVTYNAYRGVTVTELSREDVADLFRARLAIELSAVGPAIAMGEDEIRQLEGACTARERAIGDGDLHAAFEADISFHATLVAALASEALSGFFLGLLRKLRLGFYLGGGVSTEGRERDTEQHRRIVELMRAGDRKGCAAAVREHLEDAEALLLELTEASARSDEPAATGAGS